MSQRKVLVLQKNEAWNDYLREAFEDTPSTPQIFRSAEEALPFIRQGNPEIVFLHPSLLTKPLEAALSTLRASHANFRAFRLGSASGSSVLYPFDEVFPEIPPPLSDFQKRLVRHLSLPDPLRLLVVDDEPEIRAVFRDYFDHRTQPTFIVETARDGVEAEERIQKSPPHVLILDLKMPERDGRELYRELKRKEKLPPTIVFVDLVSAEEILEIRKWGNPAFVEKGSHSSTMPEMAALIKKIAYFG